MATRNRPQLSAHAQQSLSYLLNGWVLKYYGSIFRNYDKVTNFNFCKAIKWGWVQPKLGSMWYNLVSQPTAISSIFRFLYTYLNHKHNTTNNVYIPNSNTD